MLRIYLKISNRDQPWADQMLKHRQPEEATRGMKDEKSSQRSHKNQVNKAAT